MIFLYLFLFNKLIVDIIIIENVISINIYNYVLFFLFCFIKKYIFKGSVFVLFGIYFVIINVVLNLFNVWVKFIIIFVKIECLVNGKINLRKIFVLFVFIVLVVLIIFVFIFLKFCIVCWYISGKLIMIDVIIVFVKVNIIGKCSIFVKNWLIGFFGEKMINRIKFNIVGGKIIGNINKFFNILIYEFLWWYNYLDIKIFKIVIIIVLIIVICIDI